MDLQRRRHVRARAAVACGWPTTAAAAIRKVRWISGANARAMLRSITRLQGSRQSRARLDLSTSFNVTDNVHRLPRLDEHPQRSRSSRISSRTNYTNGAHVNQPRSSRWWCGIEEKILSAAFGSVSRRQAPRCAAAAAGPAPPPPAPSSPLRRAADHRHRHRLRPAPPASRAGAPEAD